MAITQHQPDDRPFCGAVIPAVTPFTPDGRLDEPAVRRMLDYFSAGGVAGVLLLGTTGEEASIPPAMRARLVAVATEHARGRLTLYAAVSDNSLAQSLEAAETYARLGVDALVARLPSYYALSPVEMLDYYRALLAGIRLPLFIYNIPITTHLSLPVEVIEALSEHPQVAGLKDSENDVTRFETLWQRLGGRPDFAIFAGSGAFFDRALLLGAAGFVPSAGNLAPRLCQQMYQHAIQGHAAKVGECQRQLQALSELYRRPLLGQTYGRIKAAMGELGLCGPAVLPPLSSPDPATRVQIRKAFRAWLEETGAAG